MDHWEVMERFKLWFRRQSKYAGGFLFQNNSGYASEEHVKYGLPSCGGGSDYISFCNGHTEFFEIKTIKSPTLNDKQKTFIKNMTNQGFNCWIVKELPEPIDSVWFYIVSAQDYRAFKGWPY